MSKNEEKERERNSKPQQRDNKLTKVNKKRGDDNELPSSERGKPDISKTFPNFSALTETERSIFFKALTTARKNVEERGAPTRQCFGTVHDEYFKYFTQDQKERKEVLENPKEISYLTSSLIISDDINKSTLKLDPRIFSDKKSRSPTTKIRVTNTKDKKLVTNEPGSWDPCELVIQKDTNHMIDLYLKKKRNETKSSNVQFTDKKPLKNMGSKTPQWGNKRNPEARRKKTESLRTCTMAKTTPKVRNTSRFDALNAEEKEIFFRTLQKAHDNIIEKNLEKKREILPLNVMMERHQADGQAMVIFTTSQQTCRKEDKKKNLRVKVIPTSRDNERLSKTRSQVPSEMREISDRRLKSAEILQKEGKETKGTDKTLDQADQSEFPFCSTGRGSKDSQVPKNTSELKKQKETAKCKEIKPKEITKCEGIKEIKKKNSVEFLKPRTKEKKKIKQKEKKSKKPPVLTNEPKAKDTLKVNELYSHIVTAEKEEKKDIKKEFAFQKKRQLKNNVQRTKKEQEKREQQKKEELLKRDLLLASQNLPPSENTDHQNLKKSDDSELIKEQCQMEEEEECPVIDKKETQGNCETETVETQETSTAVNVSEETCGEIWWKLENEQNDETINEIGNNEETVSVEEKYKMECILENEGEAETFEQNEETTLEVNVRSLISVTPEEIALLDSNLSIKEESTTGVKSLLVDDDRDCEAERMKSDSESDEQNPEPLIVETQKEVIVEANLLQEVFKGKSFTEKKLQEERETKRTAPDFALGKVMLVDDNEVEKVKKLIYYLEEKIQKDHLEKEYLQLLVNYVDYLSKVLESLVVKDERHQKQIQKTYTAPEIHLEFDDTKAQSQKKEDATRSVSNQDLGRVHSEGSIVEIKAGKSEEKSSSRKSEMEVPTIMESESSSDSKTEVRFTPINTGDRKIQTTNICLLQDLLHKRAEFVEGRIADFKIVHHPETEDFVPTGQKNPPMVFLTDGDEENKQKDRKTKFFKILLKCCRCGRSKTEENRMFLNLN